MHHTALWCIIFYMKYFFSLLMLCRCCTVVLSQNYNLQFLSKLPYPGKSTSNLDGYIDGAGREYALVGTETGLSIVNISNPASPVQVQFINGTSSFWREVRHYKNYAYVTNEGGGGLQIIDLAKLPDSVKVKSISPLGMTKSHTIFIDEKGIAYVNGPNVGKGGTIFLNLEPDPWNPVILGNFDNNYVHDCYVRNDTMWAALINDGIMKVVDVSVKNQTNAAARTKASWSTPNDFSHNCWLDSSGKYLFTTDERTNSYITCYDVSDLSNVRETDRIQYKPGSNAIGHNTYWINDYCVTSYYTEGITIHDVSRKHNMVEVGHYDTSPNYSGNQGGGFFGAWGVWPFLPSGNIIASDIEEGLYVFKLTYKRACYLEGKITDSVCGVPLSNVLIEITGTSAKDFSSLNGSYATGIADSGTYTIRVSKSGYATKTISGVNMQNGQLTSLDIEMTPISTVQVSITVRDSSTGLPLSFAQLKLLAKGSNLPSFFITDSLGEFTACDITQGNYEVSCCKWGYRTNKQDIAFLPGNSTHTIILEKGYYDDFTFDNKWVVNSTASAGKWVRAKPVGTTFQSLKSNPDSDVLSDLNTECFVTGNNGTQAGDDDVDDGFTALTSPVFDLSVHTNPCISYYRWFFNNGGNSTPNDSLQVVLTNGIEQKTVELILPTDTPQSKWKYHRLRIKDFMQPTANMRITFRTADYANSGHLVEAGVDVFEVVDTLLISSTEGLDNYLLELNIITLGGKKFVRVTGNVPPGAMLNFYDLQGRKTAAYNVENDALFPTPALIGTLQIAVLQSSDKQLCMKRFVE